MQSQISPGVTRALNSIVQDDWKRVLAKAQLFTVATTAQSRNQHSRQFNIGHPLSSMKLLKWTHSSLIQELLDVFGDEIDGNWKQGAIQQSFHEIDFGVKMRPKSHR